MMTRMMQRDVVERLVNYYSQSNSRESRGSENIRKKSAAATFLDFASDSFLTFAERGIFFNAEKWFRVNQMVQSNCSNNANNSTSIYESLLTCDLVLDLFDLRIDSDAIFLRHSHLSIRAIYDILMESSRMEERRLKGSYSALMPSISIQFQPLLDCEWIRKCWNLFAR